MLKLSIHELVHRHRLSLAQIDLLKWAQVDKKDLLKEKVNALRQSNHIQNILDQINETGVFFICIKGFALSQRIYKDPTVRYFKDIDILVTDIKDVIHLREKLLNNGWVHADEHWVDDEPRRSWYMGLKTDVSLVHKESGLMMELHWELDRQVLNLRGNDLKHFLKSHTEKIIVLNREVNVLTPELELLYLIAHGAKHAWFRLKWLVDLYHYPLHRLDLNKFESLVTQFKAFSLLAQTDELLRYDFGKGFDFEIKGHTNAFILTYYKSKIKEDVLEKVSISNFFKYLIHQWMITGHKGQAVHMFFKTIGIRPQDIAEIKLNAYWKYFFYRYYSILKRKVFDRKW
jgi:hypothetical protein